MTRTRVWFTAAAVSGSVFGLLLIVNRLGVTNPLDRAVNDWLDTHDPNRFDPIAKTISLTGNTAVVLVATLGLAVLLWYRGPRFAWLALSVVGLTGVVELVAKQPLWPPLSPDQYLRAALDELSGAEIGSSFPSGHVARVVCLALIAAALSSRRAWRAGMAALIVLAVAARTYAGGHTITDTFGGAALGLSAGSAGVAWVRWREARRGFSAPAGRARTRP
jgi:membrane-associated phospholipid phosphatase